MVRVSFMLNRLLNVRVTNGLSGVMFVFTQMFEVQFECKPIFMRLIRTTTIHVQNIAMLRFRWVVRASSCPAHCQLEFQLCLSVYLNSAKTK